MVRIIASSCPGLTSTPARRLLRSGQGRTLCGTRRTGNPAFPVCAGVRRPPRPLLVASAHGETDVADVSVERARPGVDAAPRGRAREWLGRYAPAEAAATLGALLAAGVAGWFGVAAATAYAGAIGEAIAFYAVVFVRDHRRIFPPIRRPLPMADTARPAVGVRAGRTSGHVRGPPTGDVPGHRPYRSRGDGRAGGQGCRGCRVLHPGDHRLRGTQVGHRARTGRCRLVGSCERPIARGRGCRSTTGAVETDAEASGLREQFRRTWRVVAPIVRNGLWPPALVTVRSGRILWGRLELVARPRHAARG